MSKSQIARVLPKLHASLEVYIHGNLVEKAPEVRKSGIRYQRIDQHLGEVSWGDTKEYQPTKAMRPAYDERL